MRTASSSSREGRRSRAPGRRSPRAGCRCRAARRSRRSARRTCRRRRSRAPPVSTRAPRATASATSAAALSTASSLMSGPIVTPSSVPRPMCIAVDALGDPARELVGDGLVHDEAVGRRAGLADVAELREHRAVDRLVEVGVVEHDERGVAAELHRGAQHVLSPPARSACGRPAVEPVKLTACAAAGRR